jgi:phosphonate transport system substrate-binding protein
MQTFSKQSRWGVSAILALSLACAAMGCSDPRETTPDSGKPEQVIRIGLIPEQNIFSQKERYRPLADYLAAKSGVDIDLVILPRYGNIVENFATNRLDGAFFGSFTGALALRKLGVEALARPEYLDGTSTYHGLIFVRKDSGISGADSMKGKRFAFVDKATTAGYLLPLYYFKSQGIDDYDAWLRETYFTGTHEGAIYDVLERKADIGAAKNTVYARLSDEDPRIADELEILARSPDVPENTLCVRSDLDDSLKRKLLEALLHMDRDEAGRAVLAEFGARRFIETNEDDYAVVFDFADQIGLDLETYDYMND